MTLLDALRKDEENRSRLAILFAQIALFTATIFVRNTRLYAEHDRTGFKTALSYEIIVTLVSNSRSLYCLNFIHKKCGWIVNSILNLFCLILAIVLEEIYEEIFEKSLNSLGFVLSITVLLLILLVIIRPSTDLGLFGFLIGVIGLVTHNLFGLKFRTWIVVASCFPLFVFRFWLEKHWMESHDKESQHPPPDVELQPQPPDMESQPQPPYMESQPQPPDRRCNGGRYYHISWIIEVLTVAGFHLFWVYNLFSTNCQALEGQPKSISCTSSSAMGTACVLIFILYFGQALILGLEPVPPPPPPMDGEDGRPRPRPRPPRDGKDGKDGPPPKDGKDGPPPPPRDGKDGKDGPPPKDGKDGPPPPPRDGKDGKDGPPPKDSKDGPRRRRLGDRKPLSTSSAQGAIAPKKED